MIYCNRCDGTGFLNFEQVDKEILDRAWNECEDYNGAILAWIKENDDHDVQVCDCCGDGESWYGYAGAHYSVNDPGGPDGPYAYNGGMCECH